MEFISIADIYTLFDALFTGVNLTNIRYAPILLSIQLQRKSNEPTTDQIMLQNKISAITTRDLPQRGPDTHCWTNGESTHLVARLWSTCWFNGLQWSHFANFFAKCCCRHKPAMVCHITFFVKIIRIIWNGPAIAKSTVWHNSCHMSVW